jgi:hypothetical protein
MKKIWKRKWFWPLVVILVAVAIVRMMLAIWVRDYVNRKLNEMEDYRGHVAAVELHLWRGAYTIHEVVIEKIPAKYRCRFSPRPRSISRWNGWPFGTAPSWARSNFIGRE